LSLSGQNGQPVKVPVNNSYLAQNQFMEKRMLGIILSILGVIGLVVAGVYFMKGGEGAKNIRGIVLFGLLGIIFFAAGISLVRNTKDKET
jgi:type IV secretory pathway VirB2 component (pilin)